MIGSGVMILVGLLLAASVVIALWRQLLLVLVVAVIAVFAVGVDGVWEMVAG